MTKEITCPECGGKGLHYGENIFNDEMCIKCNGQGTIETDDGEHPEEPLIGNEKLTRTELNYE